MNIHQSAYSVIITWGKYKGNSLGYIADQDISYLTWISQNQSMPEIWREAATKVLAGESIESLSLPKTKFVNIRPNINAGMILKDEHTVAIRFAYSEHLINRIKSEIDGREWEPKSQSWLFPVSQLPKMINIFGGIQNVKMSDDVQKAYNAEIERRKDLDVIRQKDDTHITINGLTLPLYPFQKVGVEFLLRAQGRAMIADQMGLGKSAQSIAYAIHMNCKTLIVCPASVVINWSREIKKFTGLDATIWSSKERKGNLSNKFHIINYDSVSKRLVDLLKINFDLLICDEVTYIKNRKTLRAKAILGSWKERRKYPGIKTKYTIFLTGTPIVNKPIEAYYLLNALDKNRFSNWYHFVQRYGGWMGQKTKNLDELHDRTKDLIIRRLKSEVLQELPPKQRNDLHIELTEDAFKEYDTLLQKLFSKWRLSGKPSVAEMPTIQRFLIEHKLPRLYEMIDEYLEDNRSLVIFSCYVEPLKRIAHKYGQTAALLTGEMTKADRQVTIDRLSKGEAKIGCISIHAGGMGIDGLQHAIDTVVFLDCDWVPATHEQAEDRTHRIGQKKPVQVYYLICDDTIDEYMRDILSEKQKMIDLITDGTLLNTAKNQSFFKEFIKVLSKKSNVQLEE